MNRRLTATASVCALAAALATAHAAPAQATYPGDPGRIAFGMADTTGRHIYAVRPDGRGLSRLTSGPYTDLCPAYSASGRRIVFCSNRSGAFEIWSMAANGRGLRQLTSVAYASFPDLSPDGSRIVFDGQMPGDANDDIFVMNSDGSGLRRLTSDSGNNDYPAWSPDGRQIAFVSDRTGVEQVFVMRADGTRPAQLTFAPVAHDEVPDWRPDGRQIAYAQGDPGPDEKIWVMNADGSNPHQITFGTADDFGPAWSPDGQHLAFLRDYGGGDRPVMITNARGADVHRLTDPNQPVDQFVPAWQPLGGDDAEGDG